MLPNLLKRKLEAEAEGLLSSRLVVMEITLGVDAKKLDWACGSVLDCWPSMSEFLNWILELIFSCGYIHEELNALPEEFIAHPWIKD